MPRSRVLLALALLPALVVAGAGSYLFVPPAGAGNPVTQPYQVIPDDVEASTYRDVANSSLTCRNATRSISITQRQVARVDLDAGVRYSRRVVQTGDRRLTFEVYTNVSEEYRRTANGSGSPTFEHDPYVAPVVPTLHDYQAVFPRLLRFEWRPVHEGADRHVLRPRSGYWVAPKPLFEIRSRLYVANASGRLVATADGELLDVTLTATTVRASTRYERLTGAPERCHVGLVFHREPASGPVQAPDWLPSARNATSDE